MAGTRSDQCSKFGWGGRIRTFTVLINSEVSYQLDHAPVVGQNTITLKDLLKPTISVSLSPVFRPTPGSRLCSMLPVSISVPNRPSYSGLSRRGLGQPRD